MFIFDSHAHYDDEAFDEDRDKVIEDLNNNGIVGVLDCGSSIEGSRTAVQLARRYDFIYAAVGVHPEFADKFDENTADEIRELSKFNKVRAIGEIGLDYYYDENPGREIQKSAFIRQMQLAEELKLPVVIHDRDAHEDTLDIMKQFPSVIGVVHCFSGSVEFAKECLKLGYYIGFTGIVTFKNSKKAAEVAKVVPLDRILVETDCPYMAPEPFRGKRNRSEYIKYIIRKLSEIKGIDEQILCNQTISNIKKLLSLT